MAIRGRIMNQQQENGFLPIDKDNKLEKGYNACRLTLQAEIRITNGTRLAYDLEVEDLKGDPWNLRHALLIDGQTWSKELAVLEFLMVATCPSL